MNLKNFLKKLLKKLLKRFIIMFFKINNSFIKENLELNFRLRTLLQFSEQCQL